MPIISIKMAEGRSDQQKQALVEAVTREAISILGVEPEWVTVLIEEYSRNNWATAGELHSIKYGTGCGKQGTNQDSDIDRYKSLMHYFKSLPWDEITVTYDDIEGIIKSPLPDEARQSVSWWSNNPTGGLTQAVNGWLAAGWQVAEVFPGEKIHFKKAE